MQASQALDGLAAAGRDCERPAELGHLEITVTPTPKVTSDDVKRYADLGVDRLVLLVNASTLDATCDRVSRLAELFI